jgi:hypothetical protein
MSRRKRNKQASRGKKIRKTTLEYCKGKAGRKK